MANNNDRTVVPIVPIHFGKYNNAKQHRQRNNIVNIIDRWNDRTIE